LELDQLTLHRPTRRLSEVCDAFGDEDVFKLVSERAKSQPAARKGAQCPA